jgi:hypothetical protein
MNAQSFSNFAHPYAPDKWRNRPNFISSYPTVFARFMTLRQATTKDLDALRDIALAAMPLDPQWNYRFPRRKDYPQDTSYWTRRQYENYFESTKLKYCVMVITVNTDGDECNPPISKPVALAVWDITSVSEHDPVTNGKKKRKYHIARANSAFGWKLIPRP